MKKRSSSLPVYLGRGFESWTIVVRGQILPNKNSIYNYELIWLVIFIKTD